MTFIDSCMRLNGNRLYSVYRILEEANRTYDENPNVFKRNKNCRVPFKNFKDNIQLYINAAHSASELEIYEELRASWRLKEKGDAKRQEEARLQELEEENERKAEAEGTMNECGCCFIDYPLNRMIHCDSADEMHFFCRTCAKKNADTEIGNGKFELKCMSMDGCAAGFDVAQRTQFLDDTTTIALERIHQESNLRNAGIENLASCPFCPYAAEYPPVEVNREFVCQRSECEKVSCRLCNQLTHIPKSCEEHAKENGLSIRRQIEEAMSEALIRKCNKCDTKFIKEEGCNKMTCSKCKNVQCYICSKSCSYDHFNDTTRGGKVGNCPLFESTEARHDEVRLNSYYFLAWEALSLKQVAGLSGDNTKPYLRHHFSMSQPAWNIVMECFSLGSSHQA